MTDLILYLAWLAVWVFTSICGYLHCKKSDDEWLALLNRHTEDWREHCNYINNNWSKLIEKFLKMPNEWTSVKDRLPNKNTKCLCYVSNPYGNYITTLTFATDLHEIDKYDFYNQHRSGFCDYDSEYGWAEYENVTHWMPLPEPPKEGADNG